jgi:hypothetical protein
VLLVGEEDRLRHGHADRAMATTLSKNLSSADHQKGLLTTWTPRAAAHFRKVR